MSNTRLPFMAYTAERFLETNDLPTPGTRPHTITTFCPSPSEKSRAVCNPRKASLAKSFGAASTKEVLCLERVCLWWDSGILA